MSTIGKQPPAQRLNGADKYASLVAAVTSIMKDRCGLAMNREDLGALIVAHAPEEHKTFWDWEGPNAISGLFQFDQTLKSILDKAGFLYMHGKADEVGRLVKRDWLTDPEKIREFVHKDPPPGARCRYCLAQEPHDARELIPAGYGRPWVADIRNGSVRYVPNTAYVHKICEPLWLQWLDIAGVELAPMPQHLLAAGVAE